MKFLLAFVTLTVVVSGAYGACDWHSVKGCLNKLSFFTNDKLEPPKNDQETQKFCKELDEARQCVNDFGNKCLTLQLSKNILKELDKTVRDYNHKICSTPAARAELEKRLVCYAKPETKSTMLILHKKYIAMVEKLPSYQKPERLDAFCCSILYIRDAVVKYNKKSCGKDVAVYIDNQMRRLFGPLFVSECHKYSSSQCKLPDHIKKDYDDILNSPTAPVTKHNNALATILDLITDII